VPNKLPGDGLKLNAAPVVAAAGAEKRPGLADVGANDTAISNIGSACHLKDDESTAFALQGTIYRIKID
jgi:uncharacterized membrane protein